MNPITGTCEGIVKMTVCCSKPGMSADDERVLSMGSAEMSNAWRTSVVCPRKTHLVAMARSCKLLKPSYFSARYSCAFSEGPVTMCHRDDMLGQIGPQEWPASCWAGQPYAIISLACKSSLKTCRSSCHRRGRHPGPRISLSALTWMAPDSCCMHHSCQTPARCALE